MGTGIGPLRFGMTPAEVRTAFAEPEVYEDWMGGNLNDSVLFRGMIVSFDRCDAHGPLANARVTGFFVQGRRDLVLEGVPLHAWTRGELRSRLAALGLRAKDGGPENLLVRPAGASFAFDAAGRVSGLDLWSR